MAAGSRPFYLGVLANFEPAPRCWPPGGRNVHLPYRGCPMPEPIEDRYRFMSKRRRLEHCLDLVLLIQPESYPNGLTISEAARRTGLNRAHASRVLKQW